MKLAKQRSRAVMAGIPRILSPEHQQPFSEATYQRNIPKCCALQTVQQHAQEIMMCWGLEVAMKNRRPMNCSGCEYNTLLPKQPKPRRL